MTRGRPKQQGCRSSAPRRGYAVPVSTRSMSCIALSLLARIGSNLTSASGHCPKAPTRGPSPTTLPVRIKSQPRYTPPFYLLRSSSHGTRTSSLRSPRFSSPGHCPFISAYMLSSKAMPNASSKSRGIAAFKSNTPFNEKSYTGPWIEGFAHTHINETLASPTPPSPSFSKSISPTPPAPP